MKMKKTTLLLAAFAALVSTLAHGNFTPGLATFQWDSQITQSVPFRQTMFAGETAAFECRLLQYGAPFITTNGTPAAFYWQTADMNENAWHESPATVSPTGVCRATFKAPQPGAVRFFFRVGETDGINYRAHGIITVAASPGSVPNTVPLPTPSIDFAAVSVFNPEAAPWLMTDDLPPPPELPVGLVPLTRTSHPLTSSNPIKPNTRIMVSAGSTLSGGILGTQQMLIITISNNDTWRIGDRVILIFDETSIAGHTSNNHTLRINFSSQPGLNWESIDINARKNIPAGATKYFATISLELTNIGNQLKFDPIVVTERWL